MTTAKDLTGQRFGMLVAVSREGYNGHFATWRYLCDCGEVVVKTGVDVTQTVRKGRVANCGCMSKVFLGNGSRKHMASTSTEYTSWRSAKGRCTNPRHHAWSRYGGAGITMCVRWLTSFESFYADMGVRPAGTSLDRIDTNGPYAPENCRWATRKEQAANRRISRTVVIDGVTMSIPDASKLVGIPLGTISKRVGRGLSADEVITPVTKWVGLIDTPYGPLSASALAKQIGVSVATVYHRLRRGYDVCSPKGTYLSSKNRSFPRTKKGAMK
jgi:transposase